MASAPIDIPIKVKGLSQIEKLAQKMKGLSSTVEKVNGRLPKAANNIQKVANASRNASNKVSGLVTGVGKLAAAFAAFQGAKAIGQIGIDSIEASRRLKALSGAFGEVQDVQLAAARAADKFGLSQREADKAFAQVYARLRPIGIELNQIESAFAGFNTAARLSGTSAQEASSAWLQLSQALGSGVLRGEELNSVFEQTPTVVQAIAEEMNAPIGQIRQLAKDGKITSDVVLRALNRLERDGVDQLAEALNGPRQKFKDFSNSVEKLSNALSTTVLPNLSESISLVGETILLLEGPIKFISGLLSNSLKQINSLIRQISKPAAYAAQLDIEAGLNPGSIVSAFTKGDPFAGAKQLFGEEGFKELKAQADEYARLRNQNARDVFVDLAQDRLVAMQGDSYIKSGLNTLPELPKTNLDFSGGGGGSGGGSSLIDNSAAEKAARLAERQNESYNDIRQSLERNLALTSDINPYLREGLQIYFDYEDAIKRINSRVDAGRQSELIALAELQKEQSNFNVMKGAASDFGSDMGEFFAGKLPEANDELTKTQELLKGSYQIVSGQLTSGIKGLIDGTKTWNDLLGDVLSNLSSMFLNFAFQGLGAGIGIPAFAAGGRPEPGQVSLIGEKGPELWVPDAPGTVLTNDQAFDVARGSMNRNGASASSSDAIDVVAASQAFGDAANKAFADNRSSVNNSFARSQQISNNKFIEEQAASANNPANTPTVNYNGPTLTFNQNDYLPVSAVPELMAQATKDSKASIFNDLKNRPATRRQLGLN